MPIDAVDELDLKMLIYMFLFAAIIVGGYCCGGSDLLFLGLNSLFLAWVISSSPLMRKIYSLMF